MSTGVRGFYLVTEFIKENLLEDINVNTVTFGELEDIDLKKQTLYPLSHLNIVSAIPLETALQFTITVISMDLVDENKEDESDIFTGNDNEQDVLNTQCAVLTKLVGKIRRNRNIDEYELTGEPTLEPFTDRFGNKVAGWVLTMDLQIPNDVFLC